MGRDDLLCLAIARCVGLNTTPLDLYDHALMSNLERSAERDDLVKARTLLSSVSAALDEGAHLGLVL